MKVTVLGCSGSVPGPDSPASGELGPFALSFATVNHPIPTSAVRITAGDRTLVYSGDTGESPDLVSLAHGADLFLCEASFGPDDEYVPDMHLTGRQAGEHATKADVGRLVVTHVPPWNSREVQAEEAASAFDGVIEIAMPGAEIWVYRSPSPGTSCGRGILRTGVTSSR